LRLRQVLRAYLPRMGGRQRCGNKNSSGGRARGGISSVAPNLRSATPFAQLTRMRTSTCSDSTATGITSTCGKGLELGSSRRDSLDRSKLEIRCPGVPQVGTPAPNGGGRPRQEECMRAKRIRVWLLIMALALGGVVSQMASPSPDATCAECGNGPRDKKCRDGYVCVDSQCVKR